MKNKNILVLGGSGFIGKNFVYKNIKNNFITVVHYKKKINQIKSKNIRYVNLDITKSNQFSKKLSLDYDYILNLSGYVDHSDLNSNGFNVINNHLIGVFNLINYYKRSKKLKKFLQIGTGDEYGLNKSPFIENKREIPSSPYSYSKTSASHFIEMAYKNIEFPSVACRIFLSYGPYQEYNRLIPQVIYGCLNNLNFSVSSGIQYRDFCYIDDVIRAFESLLLSKNTYGQTYNIGSSNPIMVKTIIKKINKLIGKGKPIFGNNPLRKNENLKLFANTSKIYNHTNWKPKISLNEGLIKTIKFYKKLNNVS